MRQIEFRQKEAKEQWTAYTEPRIREWVAEKAKECQTTVGDILSQIIMYHMSMEKADTAIIKGAKKDGKG